MTTRMKHTDVFNSIRNVAMKLKPENGKIILFGSQARGEAREDSDWDILILLDKDKIEVADHDKFTYQCNDSSYCIYFKRMEHSLSHSFP